MPGAAYDLDLEAHNILELYQGVQFVINEALRGRNEDFHCKMLHFTEFAAGFPIKAIAWYSQGPSGPAAFSEFVHLRNKGGAHWHVETWVAPHGQNSAAATLGLDWQL